jgi:SAM-dependent methyltransferase
MISGHLGIREAYRDDTVARRYVDTRFREPLGAMLHARQVAAVTRLLRTERPRRVLEIAPGPGRLTVDISPALHGQGTLVEASAQMLAEARRRLGAASSRWRMVQGDAFHLPVGESFDFVYAFRLIRHFRAAERALIYRQIAAALRPGGWFVFDAVNEVVSAPLRARAAAGEYEHYDALTQPDALTAELAAAGLEVVALEGVQRRYGALARLQTLVAPRSRVAARLAMEITDRMGGGPPLEWIVRCRRV